MSNGDQFGSLAKLGKTRGACQAQRGDSSKQISADHENKHDGETGSSRILEYRNNIYEYLWRINNIEGELSPKIIDTIKSTEKYH